MFIKHIALLSGLATVAAAGIYVIWGPSSDENKSRRKTKKRDLCSGLENLGNTCFLNAVLQALSACHSVRHWLQHFLLPTSTGHIPTSLAHIVLNLLKVINREPSVIDLDDQSPALLLQALRQKRWVISPDEQDAHELFHVLTQTLDEEVTRFPSLVSLFDLNTLQNPENEYQSVESAVTRSRGMLPILPHRNTDNPFRGLLANQLRCERCSLNYPVRYDLFDSLSLCLPTRSWGTANTIFPPPLQCGFTLDQLLRHFMSPEKVYDVECPGCARQQGIDTGSQELPRAAFTKKIMLGKLPECLCVHLQRTVWSDSGVPTKRHDRVTFPETISLKEYLFTKSHKSNRLPLYGGRKGINKCSSVNASSHASSSPAPINLLRALNYQSRFGHNGFFLRPPSPIIETSQPNCHVDINQNSPSDFSVTDTHSECIYRLVAVLVHFGDVFSGHFVTYRLSPCAVTSSNQNNKWLYVSDMHVKRVDISEVLSSEAYMLYYEKVR